MEPRTIDPVDFREAQHQGCDLGLTPDSGT
jgi:hypothetical protein